MEPGWGWEKAVTILGGLLWHQLFLALPCFSRRQIWSHWQSYSLPICHTSHCIPVGSEWSSNYNRWYLGWGLDIIILTFRSNSSLKGSEYDIMKTPQKFVVKNFVYNDKFLWFVTKRVTRSRKVSCFIYLWILKWQYNTSLCPQKDATAEKSPRYFLLSGAFRQSWQEYWSGIA